MAAAQKRIVIVTAGGPHPWIIANALSDRFGPLPVILEDGEPKSALIKRRIRRQGYLSALGQLATMALVRLLKQFASGRIERMIAENGMQPEPLAGQAIVRVPSVNAPAFLRALEDLKPDLVFLVGCRLLKADTLSAIRCPVLNYHAGITPKYRGMNGGYWALATGDAGNFGTTVHLVDAGVDTGGVLRQARGKPEPGDNLGTYAYRQAAFSRQICIDATEDALAGKFQTFDPGLSSGLWYHPTIWGYLWTGLTRGIW